MYTFIRGCLRHFFCRAHTTLHPSVTSSRRDCLLSFTRTRPWFDSDITQTAFPFTASNVLYLLIYVLTPSILAAATYFLRSNLSRGALPSQIVSHIVQAVFAFTFPIFYDAVVFCCVIIRFCCVIRHECVPWSPCSPRCPCRTWRNSSRLLHQPDRSSIKSYLWQFYYLI